MNTASMTATADTARKILAVKLGQNKHPGQGTCRHVWRPGGTHLCPHGRPHAFHCFRRRPENVANDVDHLTAS
jgi:hypothetical protein